MNAAHKILEFKRVEVDLSQDSVSLWRQLY